MDHPVDVLAYTVPDSLTIGKGTIASALIGKDRGIGGRMLVDKPL